MKKLIDRCQVLSSIYGSHIPTIFSPEYLDIGFTNDEI